MFKTSNKDIIQNYMPTYVFNFQVYDFRSFIHSVYTLFRMILGDFNFKAIESADVILGPIFFLTYIFFVFFVLLVRYITTL